MHIEVLAEDASGKALLEAVIPKILGNGAQSHTWRIIAYRGVGRIPRDLRGKTDAGKRILLDQLPRILSGYGRTPGIDAVVIVLDTDDRDCAKMLSELKRLAALAGAPSRTIFRLAIEELEAWYLGDETALLRAFPKAKRAALRPYVQDSVCGTWELLADAIHPGGSAAVKREGWPLPGQLKTGWAKAIGPRLDVDRNLSPSFGKLRDGLRSVAMGSA